MRIYVHNVNLLHKPRIKTPKVRSRLERVFSEFELLIRANGINQTTLELAYLAVTDMLKQGWLGRVMIGHLIIYSVT